MAAKVRTQLNGATHPRRQCLLSRAIGLILEHVERSEDVVDVSWLQKAPRFSYSFRPLERYLRK
jgi:hypothetical protein